MLKWAGGILGAVILLLVLFFAFLQTSTARSGIAALLSSHLSAGPDRQLVFSEPSGFIPFRIRFQEITIADHDGIWLRSKDAHLAWSPLPLLSGHIVIHEVGATEIRIERLPVSEEKERTPFSFPKPENLPRLTVDKLRIQDLHIDESVLGRSGVFAISGNISRSYREQGAGVSFHIVGKEGPESRADIEVSAPPSPSEVSVKFDLHEEPGGWVAGVLGYTGPRGIDISLEGSGPPSAWKGELSADLPVWGVIHSGIGVASGKTVEFDMQGTLQPEQASRSPKWMRLIGPAARFVLHGAVSNELLFTVERVDLTAADLNLEASGTIDLGSRKFDGSWNIMVPRLAAFESLVGMPVSGELTARGTGSGTPESPQGNISVTLTDLVLPDLSAKSVETRLDILSQAPGTSPGDGYRITGSGGATDIASRHIEAAPKTFLQWTFDVRVPRRGPVAIADLQVYDRGQKVGLKGKINPDDVTGAFDMTFDIEDTRWLTAILGYELSGKAVFEAHLDVNGRDRSGAASLRGSIANLRNIPDQVGPLVGPEITVNGDFKLTDGSKVSVSDIRVESRAIKAAGKGGFNLSDRSLEANWQITAPDLSVLGKALQMKTSGSAKAEGQVNGTLDSFLGTASLMGSGIALEGRQFEQIDADLKFADLPGKPRGTFQLELKQKDRKLVTSTSFSLQDRRLTLSPLVLTAPGNSVRGSLVVDLQRLLVTGNLDGNLDNLPALGGLLEEHLEGNARFNARFSAGKSGQDLTASAEASALGTRVGNVKALDLSARLSNIWRAPQGDLSLNLTEANAPGFVFHKLSAQVSVQMGKGELRLATRGNAGQDFDLQAHGAFVAAKESNRFGIDSLAGHFGKYPLKLIQPLSLKHSRNTWDLDPFALALGSGRLEASGSLTPGQVRVESKLAGFPLDFAILPQAPRLTGSADGSLGIDGAPSNPSARLKLTLRNVRTEESDRKGIPPAQADMDARIEGGVLEASAKIEGIVEKASLSNLTVPFRFSLRPFSWTLPPGGELRGHMEAAADLEKLAILFPMADQLITGRINAGLDLGGTVARPEATGSATLDRGSYQNLTYGTILKDLTTKATLRGDKVEIQEIRATDGGAGSLRARGWIDLRPENRFPLSVDAVFTNARLIQRGDATAIVEGNATVSGPLPDMLLGGELQIKSAEFEIPKTRPQPVSQLNVIEINLPENRRKPAKPAKVPSILEIRLDLVLSSSGHLIIRGNNLDSEWKGRLRVSGSTGNPILTGTLTTVRGQYRLLGKPFRITEGEVDFLGTSPPEPNLNISAESRTTDITAWIVFSGTFSNPNLELKSAPPLPSDEILSRVLFGRSLSGITPIQTAQLALAAKSLSGTGDTFDLLERTRKMFGLESLGFTQGPGGETGLALGKYLTEGVHVGLEKGLGNQPGKASLQIEPFPNITIQTETGMGARSGIEVDWKYDH